MEICESKEQHTCNSKIEGLAYQIGFEVEIEVKETASTEDNQSCIIYFVTLLTTR